MQKIIKDQKFLWILALGAVLYFQMAWVPGFFQDGYLYAAFGKNAAELGHWLVPHLSESTYPRFYHHTSFVFILEGLFFKLFGASFVTARIFAGLFSLLTGVYLFRFLKKNNYESIAYISLLIFYLIPPLMKKSRFPNLDLPLMLFFTISLGSYWNAYLRGKWRDWLLCGLFFGLCALTKGPMAVWIPLIIFIHLLVSKSSKTLMGVRPWAGLSLGLVIFSLWPLSLKISGNFDIFINWYKFTFLHTMVESRGEASPFYTYIIFLLKNVNLWFLLSVFGIFHVLKSSTSELLRFCVVIYLVIVISLSFMSFKYSNYLIPMYPFLAILAGFGIYSLKSNACDSIVKFFRVLTPVAVLVLLIFPVTNTSKRDPELFRAREVFSYVNFKPISWVNYKGAYPFWSLANLNGFIDQSKTYNSESVDNDSSVILVKKDKLKNALENTYISEHYKRAMFFKKKNIILLIPKRIDFKGMEF